uniref:Ubiquinol-cytochrome-c reductase complex assembly factor 3 n=1 Tax=Cyprinodon variegatus TaxID=28743 RepID=A0A3Q2D5K3_CYPVA
MMSMRTILISSAAMAAMGLGYGMWSVISPGEERRKEMLKVSPCKHNLVRLTAGGFAFYRAGVSIEFYRNAIRNDSLTRGGSKNISVG